MRQQFEQKIRDTSIDFHKSDIKLLLDYLQEKKGHLKIQTEQVFSIRQLQINSELPDEKVELLQIKVYDKKQNIKKCLEIFLTDYVEELVGHLKKYADICSRLFRPAFILKVFDSYYLDEDKIFYVIEYEDFYLQNSSSQTNQQIVFDSVNLIRQFMSYYQCENEDEDYNFQLAKIQFQIQFAFIQQENSQFQVKLNAVNPILFSNMSMRRNNKQKININPTNKKYSNAKQQFNQDSNLMMNFIEKSKQKAVMSNFEIIKSHILDKLNAVEDYFELYFEDNFFAYCQQNKLKKYSFNFVCHKFDEEEEARQIYEQIQEAISICNESKIIINPIINSEIISNSQGIYILSKVNNSNLCGELNQCEFTQVDEIQDMINNFIILAKLKINCNYKYDSQQKKLKIDSCYYFREFPSSNRSSIKNEKNNFTTQYDYFIHQAIEFIRKSSLNFDQKNQDYISKNVLDYFFSLEKGDWLISEQKINKFNLFFDQLKNLNSQFEKEIGFSFKPMFLQSCQALQIDEIKIEQFLKLIDILKKSSLDIKFLDLKSGCRLKESIIFRNQKSYDQKREIYIEDKFVDDSILKKFPNYPINYIQLFKTQNEKKPSQLLSNFITNQNKIIFSNQNGENQNSIKLLNDEIFSSQQNLSSFNNPSQSLFSSMTNQNTQSVFSNQNGDKQSSITPLNDGIFIGQQNQSLFNNPPQSLFSSIANQNTSSVFSNQNDDNKISIQTLNKETFSISVNNENIFNNQSNPNSDNQGSIKSLTDGIFSSQQNQSLFNNPSQQLLSTTTNQNDTQNQESYFNGLNIQNQTNNKCQQNNQAIFSTQSILQISLFQNQNQDNLAKSINLNSDGRNLFSYILNEQEIQILKKIIKKQIGQYLNCINNQAQIDQILLDEIFTEIQKVYTMDTLNMKQNIYCQKCDNYNFNCNLDQAALFQFTYIQYYKYTIQKELNFIDDSRCLSTFSNKAYYQLIRRFKNLNYLGIQFVQCESTLNELISQEDYFNLKEKNSLFFIRVHNMCEEYIQQIYIQLKQNKNNINTIQIQPQISNNIKFIKLNRLVVLQNFTY